MGPAQAPTSDKGQPLLGAGQGFKPSSVFRNGPLFRLLLAALLAEIGYAVLNISAMPVYLRNDRGFGEAVISLVMVAYLLSEAIFKSPMGHAADKFGHRKLMTIGPALSIGTSLLSLAVPHTGGGATEVLAFVGLRAIDGLGAAMMWPAAYALVGDLVADQDRQQAMSLLNLCYMLGIALALPIGGAVNDLTGKLWASLILAAGLFATVSLVAYFLTPAETHTPTTLGPLTPQEAGIKDLVRSMKQIPAYMLLAVVTFAGIGFPMPIIKLFAEDQFHMSETKFGALVFPAAILMAIASVPMSKFGEKIGRIKSVHLGMGLCSAGLILIGSGMIIPFLRTPYALMVGAVPVGVGFLLAIPAWMASVSDINPKSRGANLGAVMTAQGVGAIIGAPIGGAMYQWLEPVGPRLGLGLGFAHYAPFAGCAACVTAGWLIGLKILRPRQQTEATS